MGRTIASVVRARARTEIGRRKDVAEDGRLEN